MFTPLTKKSLVLDRAASEKGKALKVEGILDLELLEFKNIRRVLITQLSVLLKIISR